MAGSTRPASVGQVAHRSGAAPAVTQRQAEAGPRTATAIRRMFEHRSGRVIALCRVVLASVFLVALAVDPAQPVRNVAEGYALLGGYLLFAGALLWVAWRDWWWDRRLGIPALIVDVAVFLSAVYFTESTANDFTSPFLAFYVFLMLAVTIRWDWRVTALAAAAISLAYLTVGVTMDLLNADLDIYRFGRRVTYMVVMSVVLVWFGLQRGGVAVRRFEANGGSEPGSLSPPFEAALDYAMHETGAHSAVLAWSSEDEPWTELRGAGRAASFDAKLAPDELPIGEAVPRYPQLFDRPRARRLTWDGQRLVARSGAVRDLLAEHCDIPAGLALPIDALTGRGELILCGIDGMCADDVRLGSALAAEIAAAFDRSATTAMARSAAVERMRSALARDIHDSVAQSLAGASFRLEALRGWIRAGHDPEPEIAEIKAALRSEQLHVRSLIARLKDGEEGDRTSDIVADLRVQLQSLAAQWRVETAVSAERDIKVPAWLSREVQQLAREAIANAARHGRARSVRVSVSEQDGELALAIVDDGTGFPADEDGVQPWTISERVKTLGGSLLMQSGAGGTRLDIALPCRDRP